MEKSVDQLVEELENGPIHVRLQAVRALVERGNRRAVRPLIRALERTLGRWEDRFLVSPLVLALGELCAKEAQDILLQALDQSISSVKAEIVETLGKLDPTDVCLMRMGDLLYSNEPDEVKKSVIRGLGASGNPRILKHLLSILEGPCRSDLKEEAIRALARTGNRAAVGPLIDHFSSESSEKVKLLIVGALAHLPAPRSADFLIGILKDHSPAIKAAAAAALGRIRAASAQVPLKELLSDPCNEVREQAAQALGMIVFLS